jgi:hypothetical protein
MALLNGRKDVAVRFTCARALAVSSIVRRGPAQADRIPYTLEEYDLPDIKTKNSIAYSPGGKAAWFKDTEGNILALIE